MTGITPVSINGIIHASKITGIENITLSDLSGSFRNLSNLTAIVTAAPNPTFENILTIDDTPITKSCGPPLKEVTNAAVAIGGRRANMNNPIVNLIAFQSILIIHFTSNGLFQRPILFIIL